MATPSQGPAAQLPAGTRAPDFALSSAPGRTVSLADFRGRPVILAFYPADWSPVCGDQMALYNEVLRLHFPLLADFEPKGAVARRYGVYREGDGFSERALFVVDGDGIVRWSYVSPVDVNPGADGILRALEAIAGAGAPA